MGVLGRDFTNQKLHRLTFIRKTTRKRDSGGSYLWEALCDCGSTVFITPKDVVRPGGTQSCGCYKKEVTSVLGKKYGPTTRKFAPLIASARKHQRAVYKDCSFETFFRLSQQPCEYCGIEPHRIVNAGWKRYDHEASQFQLEEGNFIYNGLDRIDPMRGHEDDNVVPCCYECNRMKSNMTVEDFYQHTENIFYNRRAKSASNLILDIINM